MLINEPGKVMDINLVAVNEIDLVMSLVKSAIGKMHKTGIEQWGDYYPTKEIFLADIAAGALYAARIDGGIAGIVVINEIQSLEYESIDWLDKQGKALAVHRLCVNPLFQGQGIGRKLMQFAEDYARKNQYNSIRLDAFAKNPVSVGLYESLGYQRRGFVTYRPWSISYCYEKGVY
jgi:ribosomal protein S18 acetylase RimI-like enzyme